MSLDLTLQDMGCAGPYTLNFLIGEAYSTFTAVRARGGAGGSSLSVIKLVRQGLYWRRSGEYVQRHVSFVNVQSSLHENVVFSVSVRMGNATHIIFIMLNSISSLDTWYHFRLNTSCGVAVKVRSHQEKFDVNVYREGGKRKFGGEG